MRKLVVALVLLVVVAVAADLVAERMLTDEAERRLAARGLADPELSVEGFPFLTQLLARHFDRVRANAPRVDVGDVHLRRVRVVADDVDVPDVAPVTARVGRLRARGLVTFTELLRQAGRPGLRIDRVGSDRVRIRTTAAILGEPVNLAAVARVEARRLRIRVTPQSVEVAHPSGAVSLADVVDERLTLAYRLPAVLAGLELRDVTVTGRGLRFLGTGSDVVALDR